MTEHRSDNNYSTAGAKESPEPRNWQTKRPNNTRQLEPESPEVRALTDKKIRKYQTAGARESPEAKLTDAKFRQYLTAVARESPEARS